MTEEICRCERCCHMSSWHIVTGMGTARCLLPECGCSLAETCSHMMDRKVSSDDKVLEELGIMVS